MSKAKKRDVVLLPDDPSAADEFAAKAHETLAGAIADLVLNEPGGRVIGLEGTWGSGKSTVVGLLSAKLASDQLGGKSTESRAVIFDAWAHQGDPLRRSFLETVIEELENAGWLSRKSAEAFRANLSGKTSTVHMETTSRLSLEGKVAAAAATLVPLGALLAANRFSHDHRLFLVIGALMLAGPLMTVLAFLIAKAFGVVAAKVKPGGWRGRLSELRPFGFFANEQDTDTTTTGIERGDPTSVEFAALFDDVLDAALTDSRRLLLVLDNLDRVDAADAKRVLGTMQTFTSTSTPKRGWSPGVWTLIPYDPTGLDRLWHPVATGPPEGGDDDDPESLTSPISAAFIEKVFQIRFETPPLVLSDWRAYLLRLLGEAIPGEADLAPVTRLRALYPGAEPEGLVATETATPRHLKQFVNQIGASRRLRSDIPLVHLAYYALLRHDRVEVAPRLIDGSLPHPGLKHLLGASIDEDLAALHFGTTQGLAQQLLLGGALEQALAAGETNSVSDLKERSGFADALESLDLGTRAGDGGIELTRAVAVLHEAGALEGSSVQGWWSGAVLTLAREQGSWSLSGKDTGVGLAILFKAISADGVALTDLLAKIEPAAREADTDGRLQLEGLAGLAEGLADEGTADDALRIRVTLPTDRIAASLAFFAAETSHVTSRRMLEIAATPSDVADALIDAVTGEGSGDAKGALDVLLARPERLDSKALGAGCIEWLSAQDPTSAEQAEALLDVLDRVRDVVPSEEILGAAADDGTLMHVVAFAQTNAWSEEAGAASMLHLAVRPGPPAPAAVRSSAAGAQLIRQSLVDPSVNADIVAGQTTWLENHDQEAFPLLIAILGADATSRPWVDHQLKVLWKAGRLSVTAAEFSENWSHLKDALEGESFDDLAGHLLADATDRAVITSGSSDASFALIALKKGSETAADYLPDVRAWAATIVMSSTASDWESALATPAGSPLIDLAVELSGSPKAPSDPPGLVDALHVHFRALASSEPAWNPDGPTFSKLTELLRKSARSVLASELCAALEPLDGQVGPELFATYGPFLADQKSSRTHEKLPNFIERAVAHDQWDSVEWFVGVAEQHADALQGKNREDGLEHLKSRVAETLAALGEDEAAPEPLAHLDQLLRDAKS